MNFSFSFENNIDSKNQIPFFFFQNDISSIKGFILYDNFSNSCSESFVGNIDNINENILNNSINNEEERDIQESSNNNEEKKTDEEHKFLIKNDKNIPINENQNLIPILPCEKKEKDIQKNNVEVLTEKNENNESEKEIKIKEEKIDKEKKIHFLKI